MGGVPIETNDAPVTGACQRARSVSEEAGVDISSVAKGVATAKETLTSGFTGDRRKWNLPGSKCRAGRRWSG